MEFGDDVGVELSVDFFELLAVGGFVLEVLFGLRGKGFGFFKR